MGIGAKCCPKCRHKVACLDGKKLPGGIPGHKYYVCIPCNWCKPVKHRRWK
jgi:hypothetical protein